MTERAKLPKLASVAKPARPAKPATPCANLNHRRSHPPFRHCSRCGGVVNERVSTYRCTEVKHAAARREQGMFCVDCGTRLMVA